MYAYQVPQETRCTRPKPATCGTKPTSCAQLQKFPDITFSKGRMIGRFATSQEVITAVADAEKEALQAKPACSGLFTDPCRMPS